MGVRRFEELVAWQLADALQSEVYRLVFGSADARSDLRYKSQILDAADGIASNISEGFLRCSPGDFCRFLDYAVSSLGETERRLRNGIKRGYFDAAECSEALRYAKRGSKAIVRLKLSQRRDWRRGRLPPQD